MRRRWRCCRSDPRRTRTSGTEANDWSLALKGQSPVRQQGCSDGEIDCRCAAHGYRCSLEEDKKNESGRGQQLVGVAKEEVLSCGDKGDVSFWCCLVLENDGSFFPSFSLVAWVLNFRTVKSGFVRLRVVSCFVTRSHQYGKKCSRWYGNDVEDSHGIRVWRVSESFHTTKGGASRELPCRPISNGTAPAGLQKTCMPDVTHPTLC